MNESSAPASLGWALLCRLFTLAGLLMLFGVGAWWFSPDILAWYARAHAKDWGFDSIDLKLSRPGWQAVDIQSLVLRSPQIDVDAQALELHYDLTDLDNPLTTLRAALVSAALDIETFSSATASTAPQTSATGMPWALLPEVEVARLELQLQPWGLQAYGSLSIANQEVQVELQATQPAGFADMHLQGSLTEQGGVELDWRFADAAQPLLAVQSERVTDGVRILGRWDLSGIASQRLLELLQLDGVAGSTRGRFDATSPWPLPTQFPTGLEAQGEFTADLSMAEATGSWTGTFTGNAAAAQIELSRGRIDTPLVRLEFVPATRLELTPTQLRVATPFNSRVQLDDTKYLSARVEDLSINYEPPQNLHGSLRLATRDLRLPVTFEFNFDGSFTARAQSRTTLRKSLLAGLVSGWQAPFDFDAGRLGIDVQMQSDVGGVTAGTVSLSLDDLQGHYDGDPLLGLSGEAQFQVMDTDIRLLPSKLKLRQFDIGFPVRDVQLQASWSGDMLKVEDVSASLLGGQASVDVLQFNLAQASSSFDVFLHELDLEEILALEGADITGSGRLSGSLPVEVEDGNVSIEQGTLVAADGGGHIKLSPSLATPTGQPGLDFAMQALTNFTYESMMMSVEYAANGDTNIKVNLRGRNPDIERGRLIHYNLNVTENILSPAGITAYAKRADRETGTKITEEVMKPPAIKHTVILSLAGMLAACTPTLKVATDEPITINLNVNIQHEIRIKVDKDLDELIQDDELF